MTRWDAVTIVGGLGLAGGAYWIWPPLFVIVISLELMVLGVLMDARQSNTRGRGQ